MKTKGKLSGGQQLQLCQWIAELKTPSEIQTLIFDQCGITLDHSTVIKTYINGEKWKVIISDMRKKFMDAYMDVPVAIKRIRLERLEKLYQEAVASQKNAIAIQALREARVEVEGVQPETVVNNKSISVFQNITEESKNLTIPERIRLLSSRLAMQYRKV